MRGRDRKGGDGKDRRGGEVRGREGKGRQRVRVGKGSRLLSPLNPKLKLRPCITEQYKTAMHSDVGYRL